MIISIDVNTVAVETAADLEEVISVNSATNYVYFAKDIALTRGITIHPNRVALVLDGEYPAGSGTIHTFTDMQTEGPGDSLGVRAASSIQITLRNMKINGRNFYGTPYVFDSSSTRDLSITYENVVFSGRQMTYNRHGTTRYIDCDISIANVGSWAGEEVGEVSKLEIGGKTTITKSNNVNSTFWFCGDTGTNSFKILADAEVSISTAHYLMFLRRTADAIPYTIEPGASFRLATNSGLSYNNDHQVSSFLVGKNASFEYTQAMRNGTNASLSMTGTLTVKSGARFLMRADYSDSAPLIRFRTSESHNNLNLEDPKSFVLYKSGTPALSFDSTRPFVLSGGQVNYWQTAMPFPTAGTFDDLPLYPWHNSDWSGFDIKGNVGASTSISSTTLAPPIAPPLSNLTLEAVRVLSVGTLPLTIDPATDDHRPITGTTDPHANIKVEYTDGSGSHMIRGTADENGYFSVPTPGPIPIDTRVKVSGNVPFLYVTAEVTVQAAGGLSIIDAPARIQFVAVCLCQVPLILARSPHIPIVVFDDRVYRTKWELMATIDGSMHAENGHILPGGTVFVPAKGAYPEMDPLEIQVGKCVYTGEPILGPTPVSWDEDMGLLLHLSGPLHLNEEYTANITWTVRPVEP